MIEGDGKNPLSREFFFFFLIYELFLEFSFLKNFFIVIQLQLSAFSPHPSTPPQPNPLPSPESFIKG